MPTNCESVTPAKNLSPAQQCTTAHVARCSAMIATRKRATTSTTRNRRTSQQYHRTVTLTSERNSPQQRDDRPSRPLHQRPAAHHGQPATPRPDENPRSFCGTGKVARLKAWLPQAEFFGYEIERSGPTRPRDMAGAASHCTTGDSRADAHTPTPCSMRSVASPTYGKPHGGSSRRHDHLRRQGTATPHVPTHARPAADTRKLRSDAMGRRVPRAARGGLAECRRVLKPGGSSC